MEETQGACHEGAGRNHGGDRRPGKPLTNIDLESPLGVGPTTNSVEGRFVGPRGVRSNLVTAALDCKGSRRHSPCPLTQVRHLDLGNYICLSQHGLIGIC